jgi:hypothetical protein
MPQARQEARRLARHRGAAAKGRRGVSVSTLMRSCVAARLSVPRIGRAATAVVLTAVVSGGCERPAERAAPAAPAVVPLSAQVEPPPASGDDAARLPDTRAARLLPRRLWVEPGSPALEVADAMREKHPDDAALLDRLGASPTGVWLGGWTKDPK